MIVPWLRLVTITLTTLRHAWSRVVSTCLFTFIIAIAWMSLTGTPPALAGINDDRFDGNIFALYGGNGSLVPPRVTLAASLERSVPALLIFYVDDSSDCKKYATVVSRLQQFYGRAADFMPINIDAIPQKSSYQPNEPGYYYRGFAPQTVLLNQQGKVVFDHKGLVSFEKVDDVLREVFNLLPRSESVELKRRPINEINTELVP